MDLFDIGIIGAGPVGNYLAEKLARLGYKVAVIEKKISPCDSVNCTGIISSECCDLLSITDSPVILSNANSAVLHSPFEQQIYIHQDRNIAYIVDRPELNNLLAQRASARSVSYFYSSKVTTIEITESNVCLTLIQSGQMATIQCQMTILCTGFDTELCAKLGLGKIAHFTIGAQALVESNHINTTEIFLNKEITRDGFAWLVPLSEGKAYAGLLASSSPRKSLNKLVELGITRNIITNKQIKPQFSLIPLLPLPRTYAKRLLVVGEAAGQVKPFTGGGIYYGLLCANIAVRVIEGAFSTGNFSAGKLSQYQKEWKHKLGKEIYFGYFAKFIWKYISNKQTEALFRWADKGNLNSLMSSSKTLSFDWHTSLISFTFGTLNPFEKSKKRL